MTRQYDVFISFKNRGADELPTHDSELATEVYRFLSAKGMAVFCNNASLEEQGEAQYKKAIDNALDAAHTLVAVGTSGENLRSQWVHYEWDGFYNDILSGTKPQGRVFVYVEGMDIAALPRALRQCQTFTHAPGSLDRLYKFIVNASGKQVPDGIDLVEAFFLGFYVCQFVSFAEDGPSNPLYTRIWALVNERIQRFGLCRQIEKWDDNFNMVAVARIEEALHSLRGPIIRAAFRLGINHMSLINLLRLQEWTPKTIPREACTILQQIDDELVALSIEEMSSEYKRIVDQKIEGLELTDESNSQLAKRIIQSLKSVVKKESASE